MNDKQLIESCARFMGMKAPKVDVSDHDGGVRGIPLGMEGHQWGGGMTYWNPLKNDEQCFRLMCKAMNEGAISRIESQFNELGSDPIEACKKLRRTIVVHVAMSQDNIEGLFP